MPPDDTRASFRDVVLRARLGTLAAYHVFFTALAASVLIPLSTWAGDRLLSSTGRLSVSNEEILSFALSPTGLAWLLVTGALALALVVAESGGVMLIAWSHRLGRPLTPVGAMIRTVRILPRLVRLAGMHVAAQLVLLAPFLAGGYLIYRTLLSSYDINYLVSERPPVWWVALGLAGLLALGVLAVNGRLYVLWSLSAPAVLIGGEQPWASLRTSSRMVRQLGWRFSISLLALGVAILLTPALVPGLFDLLGRLILAPLPDNPAIGIPVLVLFIAAYILVSLAASFLVVALNALLATHAYGALRPPETAAPAGVEGEGVSKRAVCLAGPLVWGGWSIVLAGAVAIGAYGFFTVELRDEVAVTAHRGNVLDAPENTVSAILQAIEDGADYAEIDVQETADGVPVLLHDTDFLRVAGLRKKIWEVRYEEVRDLDVGSWFGPEFRDERVPTLAEAVRAAKGRIRLNVELKVNRHEERLPERVAEVLRQEEAGDWAIVSSLSYPALQRVRKVDPEIRIAYVVADTLGDITVRDVEAIALSSSAARPGLVVSIQDSGKEAWVWTVNDPRRMSWFIDMGVDNIITDRPAELAALLEERRELSDWELLLLKLRNWLRR